MDDPPLSMKDIIRVWFGIRPTLIFYDKNGIKHEMWKKNGQIHRGNDKPAVTEYRNGNIIKEEWYDYGQIHRGNDKPAVVKYENDHVVKEEWYNHGHLNRDHDKPAVIIHNNDGTTTENFYRLGELYEPQTEGICDICFMLSKLSKKYKYNICNQCVNYVQ